MQKKVLMLLLQLLMENQVLVEQQLLLVEVLVLKQQLVVQQYHIKSLRQQLAQIAALQLLQQALHNQLLLQALLVRQRHLHIK